MSRIVIIQFWSYYLSGNVFYLEELAQYLEQVYNLKNIYVYNICKTCDRTKLLERYTYLVKETNYIQKGDIIFTVFNGLVVLLKQQPYSIQDASKIFIISDASIEKRIKQYMRELVKYCFPHAFKFRLLIDPIFSTSIINANFFKNNVFYYTRGFYFKNYKETTTKINKYLLYFTKVDGYDITPYFLIVDEYCKKHNLEYIFGDDDQFQSYHVASVYNGVLYTRQKDYTPRLPYEFWYYNKPTILFDRSDGLLRRYTIEELPLYTPIYKTNIPLLNISQEVFK